MSLTIVILAAGMGKRMRSARPKVLHPVAGKPMLAHVLDVARTLSPQRLIVVYGHGGEAVKAAFADASDIIWQQQAAQLGTGDAVKSATAAIDDQGQVLVLYADTPLIDLDSVQQLIHLAGTEQLAWLTVLATDPTGYGRILRNQHGHMVGIREQKDCSADELALTEVNSGIFVAPAILLKRWVNALRCDNQQGEYYLTDIAAMAIDEGHLIQTIAGNEQALMGVNDRVQLAAVECLYQLKQAQRLMLAGVTLSDPHRIDIRGDVMVGQDSVIDVNVILEGVVRIGERVHIGAGCILKNCQIGDDSQILPYSIIDGAIIHQQVQVGPFARLRQGTVLENKSRIGNFVETKNAYIAEGAKANHLSYLGDCRLGKAVNIGAGTITCNYDGANKWLTEIADHVFIGSNSALVAPLSIAEGATIGAGSTITADVAAYELVFTRAPLKTKAQWSRPQKKCVQNKDE